MGLIPFKYTYQKFTRYIQGNCDSEQLRDHSSVNEDWLYRNMEEYLSRWGAWDLSINKYKPAEWGGRKAIDIVGFKEKSNRESISMVMEAKLLVSDTPRDWVEEVLEDIFRVACLKDKTHRKTNRFVMVVAQQRFIDKLKSGHGEILTEFLKFESSKWKKKCYPGMTEARLEKVKAIVPDYAYEMAKELKRLTVKLKGFSASTSLDQPESAITAFLWQVFPDYT